MNVLLVTQLYPPEPDIKAHVLARELVARGHKVSVVTAFPSYPLGKIYDGYRQRPIQREQADGIDVTRMPIIPDHSLRPFRRSAYYSSFFLTGTIGRVLRASGADIVWAYLPPLTTGNAARIAAKFGRCPLVLEVQDLWPESLPATGVVKSRVVLAGVRSLARRLYKAADALIVSTEGFRDALRAYGVDQDKLHYIPNWAPDDDGQESSSAELPSDFVADNSLKILYAGNIGPAQELDSLLRAAAHLRNNPDIRFYLVGDGADVPRLKGLAAELGCQNVTFIGRQDRKTVHALFQAVDLLFVQLRDTPLFQITVPSKIHAYMAAGRPILGALTGEPAALVKAAGGVATHPGDVNGLVNAIAGFVREPKPIREERGERARRYYLANHSIQTSMPKYEALFLELIAAKRG